MGLTARLADLALNTPVALGEGVPRDAAVHALTDSLGVCVAGGGSGVAHALDRYRTAFEPDTQRAVGPSGALLLGALGHALDYDDSVPLMPGHPSVPVLAAMVADLPAEVVTGRDFLDAYIIGVEVAAKVGRSIGGGHYRQGWHSTSTHGCLGATAALARLHGVDETTLRTAFGIAVSLVNGVQANFGTMTKPLHAGFAAQNAVTALGLAVAGATANLDALEADQGYFDVYGNERSEPETLTSEFGTPWAFDEPGVYLKRYPCCYATHRGIAAITQLMTEEAISADDIASIEGKVPIGGLRPLRYHRPHTGFEGKFSMEFSLAATAVDGDVGLRSFTDESVNRPEIQRLIEATEVFESPDCCPDDPEGLHGSAGTRGFIRVAITTTNGATHISDQAVPPGARENRLPEREVRAKFLDCFDSVGRSAEEATSLADTFLTIERCTDVREPLRRLREACITARA